MSGLGWLSFLIVGLIAGWIADKVMQRGHSLLENLVVGVIGAYLGAFLFRRAFARILDDWIADGFLNLRDADEIATGENLRDGSRLNRRGFRVTSFLDGFENAGVESE